MAFNAGEIMKFTVRQEYDSQECLNIFYYEWNVNEGGTLTAADVGEAFWNHVQDDWRAMVSVGVTFDRVIIENLDGDLQYGEYVIPALERAGEALGTGMASFVSYGIQLNRTTRAVRQGAKRLVGVSEDYVGEKGVLAPTTLAGLQVVADVFAADISFGLGLTINPVIVGFPTPSRPVRVAVPIDTATAKTYVTTQNTRKRGSGS